MTETDKATGKDAKPVPQGLSGGLCAVADQIDELGSEVMASFAKVEAGDRAEQLARVTQGIMCDLVPFLDWLERHRPPETADRIRSRLFHVVEEAVACAKETIPEYAGGTMQVISIPYSAGLQRTYSMALAAYVLARQLRGWANDIAAEKSLSGATSREEPGQQGGSIKRPPEKAMMAWRLRDLQGINNQTELAKKLTEMGYPATQGQVSRWLEEVKRYLAEGGVLPRIEPLKSKPSSMDPALLNLGSRRDGRTQRQRSRRADDSRDE